MSGGWVGRPGPRAVLSGVGLTLVVSLLLFLGLNLLPGDAASQSQGLTGTAQSVATQRSAWGLDRPVLERYLDWLGGVLTGDLGTTLRTGRPVAQMMAGPLERSAVLAGLALVTSLVLGVGAGLVAGLRADRPADRIVSVLALAAVCTPEFVVAVALVTLFAATLHLLPAVSLIPVGGTLADRPEILVLPVLTLTTVAGAALARLVRPTVRAQAAAAHVEAARLAGLPGRRVLTRHLLPGAIGPIAVLAAMLVPYLLGGAVVVETVFGFPGLGSLLVDAVTAREPALVMAVGMVLVLITMLAFAAAELVAVAADPRRRTRS